MARTIITVGNIKGTRYVGEIPEEAISDLAEKYSLVKYAPGEKLYSGNVGVSAPKRLILEKLGDLNRIFGTNISREQILKTKCQRKWKAGKYQTKKEFREELSEDFSLDKRNFAHRALLNGLVDFYTNYYNRMLAGKSEEEAFQMAFDL